MVYDLTVVQFTKMLRNLQAILGKSATYAESKKFDLSVLLHSRLAPDQFNLLKQIQIVTDTAKLGLARLTGKEAPTHADQETTLSELTTRIGEVVAYLNQISAKDLQGYEDKKISHPRWEGKYLTGAEFVNQHLVPNFYFHMVTAYSILRHNGLDIGKKDYLGEMPFKK